MATPTPQQPRLDGLSLEVHNIILAHLIPPGKKRYSAKKDLQTYNLVCKATSAAVKSSLFQHMSVTIRLNDVLPLDQADWTEPGLVGVLRDSPWIAEHIKSLRLRIELFPFRNWDDEEFAALVARWAATSDAGAFDHRTMTSAAPSTPSPERGCWVVKAYSSLWKTRLAQWYPLLQKTRPLVVALFELLPKVKHVEAGRWHKRVTRKVKFPLPEKGGMETTMRLLSDSGAATALVDTFPSTVKSYSFRCHINPGFIGAPAQDFVEYLPLGIDNQPMFDPVAATGPDPNWMDFTTGLVRRSPQLERLDLNICNLQSARFHWSVPSPVTSPDFAVTYWRTLLLFMHNLKEFTLTTSDEDMPPTERVKHLVALTNGMVMPSVRRLHLKGWVVPPVFLSERVWVVFPNIEDLSLQDVATAGGGTHAWHTSLSQLPEEAGARGRTVRHRVWKAKRPPYAGPDMLSPLPTELHDRILEFLVRDGDEQYVNKQDIQAVHSTCHAISAAAKPWLFRHIAVTIRLDGELPVQHAQWEAPRLLRLLEAAPWIGELVKSLQLRIEPFPTREWTDAEFDDFVSRWNSLPGLRAVHQIPEDFRLHPRFRQMWVQHTYMTHLKEWLSQWYRTVQGVQQHVVAMFQLLPAVRHIEAGLWRMPPREEQSLFPDHEPYELLLLSYAGAATALLSALPTQADSYSFRYHPDPGVVLWHHLHQRRGHLPFGIDNQPFLDYMRAVNPGQDAELMHFTTSMNLRTSQMHSFGLDIGDLEYDWIDFQNKAIELSEGETNVYWRRTLQSMHNLSKLELTSRDGQVYLPGLPRDSPVGLAMSSQLCGDRAGRHLDALLDRLVMPSVTSLRLNSWAVTVSTVLSVLRVAFPNLKILVLEAVILVGDSADAWNHALSVLSEPTTSARSISIEVIAPKFSVVDAGKEWWQITVLDSANASAFRHVVKGCPHPKT
ncbi:hypothetical protein LTR27_011337 [Elasticomyces elasticus]|nr:hypothetical protein LTR27_011337 [Elasticomyces elasticus]